MSQELLALGYFCGTLLAHCRAFEFLRNIALDTWHHNSNNFNTAAQC